jgi:Kef-type K+ transport system membrane component KefB
MLSILLGLWVLPWVIREITRLPISQGLLTVSLIIMFMYGIAAEFLGGMAAITGAFLAGLMLGRCPEKELIESGTHALAYGLFVPVFFVNIGLSINLHDFRLEALLLTITIIFVAVSGKWLGAGLGARLGGLSKVEAFQLGAGMISRGEVGLIVADVGVRTGLLNSQVFSATVVIVLVTTLITPPILRSLFAQEKARAAKQSVGGAQDEVQAEAPISSEEEVS